MLFLFVPCCVGCFDVGLSFFYELCCIWLYQVVPCFLLGSCRLVQVAFGCFVWYMLCKFFFLIIIELALRSFMCFGLFTVFQIVFVFVPGLYGFVFGSGCENDSGCIDCSVGSCCFRLFFVLKMFFVVSGGFKPASVCYVASLCSKVFWLVKLYQVG